MEDYTKELTAEMLPEGLWRQIAEAIGVENFCKLADMVGGATVYIPKVESIIRPVRDARVKAEFNGWNYIELAQKYNITERLVRSICGPGIIEGQIDFFEDWNTDSQK